MHPLRRLIWTLVLVLVVFITIVLFTVPSGPTWFGNLPVIGSYLEGCTSGSASRGC